MCQGDLSTCGTNLSTAQGNLTTCQGDLGTCQANQATCNAGTAGASDVLNGQTFSSSGGLGIIGTMTNVGQQNVTPGTAAVALTEGFHDGSGSVAGDPDLVATNIAGGVDIFGVVGNLVGASGCGNGVIDAGEDCDFGVLNGETCATQLLFGDGLACTPGPCLFDTSGCSATRYEDTGLGTVIDHQTGLEWQKTDDAGGLTDKANAYTWTADGPGGTAPNGTVFTAFLGGLNGAFASSAASPTTGCYAGHCDWRLPVVEEIHAIVDCTLGQPCFDQAVFGPRSTTQQTYW